MIMCFLKDIFMNLCLTFRQRACCHLTHLKCCGLHQQQWPLNLPRMVPAGSAPRTRKLSSQYKFMITKSRWETFGCHPTVTAWHLGGVWQKPVMQLVKLCHTWDKKKTTQAYDADYKKENDLDRISTVKRSIELISGLVLLFRGVFPYIPVENWLTRWCQFQMLCSDYNGSFMLRKIFCHFDHHWCRFWN